MDNRLSKFNTTQYLIDRYGSLRLDMRQLAEALNKDYRTIMDQISAERFPIPTHKDSEARSAKRYAKACDVGEYLDKL